MRFQAQGLFFILLTVSCYLVISTKEPGMTEKSEDTAKESKQKQQNTKIVLPKKVAIIGGGIAGLAAARRLSSDRSNFSVEVYEARKDRFGGRVWTEKITNMKARGLEVDLGGSAFNVFAKSNPLIELAEDFELKSASLKDLQFIIPWEGKTYSGDGISEITVQAAQILGQALNESKTLKVETSVKEAVDKVLEKNDIVDADSPAAHLVKSLPSYILADYSTRSYKAELLDIGYERVLLDGMGELVDRLVSGSTEEAPLHLNLNKAVRQIKVDKSNDRVLVRFRDGSQVSADVIIVAVPLSIIASQDLMFEPDLPKKYQLAVNEISMSAGNKVIVEFEHPFWPADFDVFVRAVKTDAERGNLQTWVNVNRLMGRPVLTSFLTGEPAVKFEKLTDEEVEQSVIAVLIEMFGENTVKQGGNITRLQRSQWVSDALSKGASTYPKVGSDPSLWDTFADPLCPYIYFAGEHTAFQDHGTLHGAYSSGIRAADQIKSGLCEILRREEEKRKEEERLRKEKAKKKNKTQTEEGSSDSVPEQDDDTTEDSNDDKEILSNTENSGGREKDAKEEL